MISYQHALKRIQRFAGAICLFFALVGCEVAQDRVYISIASNDDKTMFESSPSQALLFETIQAFFSSRGFRCRQHVKWWDEWSCAGPNSMQVTFQPDRGRARIITEFTMVIRSDEFAANYRVFVDEFVDDMTFRFPAAVLYAAR